MPRRQRNDAEEILAREFMMEAIATENNRLFSEPLLRDGSITVFNIQNGPEPLHGMLGPIVPMDDVIMLAMEMRERRWARQRASKKRRKKYVDKWRTENAKPNGRPRKRKRAYGVSGSTAT